MTECTVIVVYMLTVNVLLGPAAVLTVLATWVI